MKTSLRKVVKETSYGIMMQCMSRMLAHPLCVISMRWMVQFVGWEANAYLVDDSFHQALAIRSHTKGLMGITVSMLTYPFLLVDDFLAVNNCGLQAGLPCYSLVFKSWIHCWKYLSMQGQLFQGSSLLLRWVSSGSCFVLE
ncbi:hypothetical protein H8959_009660 [Pygathrix nigripes]